MHIFLYGPPGSGKSTVGKLLAQALNIPFLDLDTEIESLVGQTVPQIMAGQGELAFRDAEASTLKKTALGEEKVVALGGGTLLRTENRALAETTGQVILLNADLPIFVRRLSRDGNERPLLAGELEAKLADLLECRRDHYASFPLRVDSSKPLEQVSWDIQRLLGRYHLRGMGMDYDVIVQEGGIDQLGELLKSRDLHGPVLVVSDTNVAPR